MRQYITKCCSTCKEVKPISDFHKNRTQPDGFMGQCKECRNEHGRKWYEENQKLQIERSRKSYTLRQMDNDPTATTHKCKNCGKSEPEIIFKRRKANGRYYKRTLCTGCMKIHRKNNSKEISKASRDKNNLIASYKEG